MLLKKILLKYLKQNMTSQSEIDRSVENRRFVLYNFSSQLYTIGHNVLKVAVKILQF